jgi:hypothetical protein
MFNLSFSHRWESSAIEKGNFANFNVLDVVMQCAGPWWGALQGSGTWLMAGGGWFGPGGNYQWHFFESQCWHDIEGLRKFG